MTQKVYTVLIGGKAGEGIKKAAQVIAHIAIDRGLHVFQSDDYQSLIKGGHNFSTVSISDEVLYNSYQHPDLLISFDSRSVEKHQNATIAKHYCNLDDCAALTTPAEKLPLGSLMKQQYPEGGNVSLSAVAIFCAETGVSEAEMVAAIKHEFRRNAQENISYAVAIYRLVQPGAMAFANAKMPQIKPKFYSGNQLIALGAWAAGMDFYYGYPMTPASSILHYLAIKKDSHRVYAIHAESELAAANMAIGSCFAGKRSAVGSSGGGFALMQEAFSLAGMVEAPILFVLSSRPGPATGVSTYTAQEDLFFALNQGHGEFSRIVASPDSFERAFTLAAELMDLAWETQSPAILLTEKHLSECSADVDMNHLVDSFEAMPYVKAKIISGEGYQRYQITEDGISPLKYPGRENCEEEDVIKWNSHEHLESGLRTDGAEAMKAMKEKRNRKAATIIRATQKYKRVNVYGCGDNVVFAYGSTALELREAQKYLDFTLVVPIYLDPFPQEELQQYQDTEVVIVEHSSRPNFAEFLRQKLGIKPQANILRYDGRPFCATELVTILKEAFDA